MVEIDISGKFVEAVSKGIDNIKKDLAYLALTSKPEHAVRDAIALSLHRDPKLEKYKVARELHLAEGELNECRDPGAGNAGFSKGGIDLAILDSYGKKLKLIAELKAMYSFDMVRSRRGRGGELTVCASMAKGISHDINQTAHIAGALGVDHAYVMAIVMMPWAESHQFEELERVARYKMTEPGKIAIGESGHDERLAACRKSFQGANGFALKKGVECELLKMQPDHYKCGEAYGINFNLFPFLMKVSKTSAH